jgi:hypothetical protein
MCAAEYEELSPWSPLHVERGLASEQSAVTVVAVAGLSDLCDIWAKDGEELADCLSKMMAAQVGTNWLHPNLGESALMICPTHAQLLAEAFPDKRDFQAYLNENCRIPEGMITAQRAAIMKERGVWLADERGTIVTERPEQWFIFVAGGLGGYHACYLHTFSVSYAVTLPIDG